MGQNCSLCAKIHHVPLGWRYVSHCSSGIFITEERSKNAKAFDMKNQFFESTRCQGRQKNRKEKKKRSEVFAGPCVINHILRFAENSILGVRIWTLWNEGLVDYQMGLFFYFFLSFPQSLPPPKVSLLPPGAEFEPIHHSKKNPHVLL